MVGFVMNSLTQLQRAMSWGSSDVVRMTMGILLNLRMNAYLPQRFPVLLSAAC